MDAPPINMKPIKPKPLNSEPTSPKLILPRAVSCCREAASSHFVHLGEMQPEMLWPKQNGGAG